MLQLLRGRRSGAVFGLGLPLRFVVVVLLFVISIMIVVIDVEAA
jgi:hypothetical protein